MNVARLQRLKRLILAEHAWEFNMYNWFSAKDEDFNLLPRDGTKEWADIEPSNFCGTAACALGTAALDPQFQSEGLRLVARLNEFGEHVAMMPAYRGRLDFEAAEKFFDISNREAHDLFGPSGMKAPAVAAKIDALLARS